MKKLKLLFIFFILLSAYALQSDEPSIGGDGIVDPDPSVINDDGNSYMEICLLNIPEPLEDKNDLNVLPPLVALISVSIIAIGKMFAASSNNPQLDAWVKVELSDLIAGAILVSIIYSLTFSINNFFSDDEFAAIYSYICSMESYIFNYLDILTLYISRVGAIAGTTFSYLSVFLIDFFINKNITPNAGLNMLMMPASQAVYSLTLYLYALKAMKIIVSFIQVINLSLLLPIAASLRLFPFTKKIGSTMLALVLVLSYGFPISISIANYVNNFHPPYKLDANIVAPIDVDYGSGYSFMTKMCSNSEFRAFAGLNEMGWGSIFCPIYCIAHGLIGGLGNYFSCLVECMFVTIPNAYAVLMLAIQLTVGYVIQTSIASVSEHIATNAGSIFDSSFYIFGIVHHLLFLLTLNFIIIGMTFYLLFRAVSTAIGGERYLSAIERLI